MTAASPHVASLTVPADPPERERVRAILPERDRDVCCPGCSRHIGKVRVYGSLPPLCVWTQRQCPSCRRWTWFECATGEAAGMPSGPD